MRLVRYILSFVAKLVLVTSLGGCAPTRVEVWQRDLLARPEMQFADPSNATVMSDHIYFSKEASSGGRGFGGGGCGCN